MSTPEIYRYDGENPPVKVGGVSALLPALVPISYQDFMNLTQEEQESGSYIVTNMPTLMNAYSLGYKDGLSAGQKLDQLSSDLTELGTAKLLLNAGAGNYNWDISGYRYIMFYHMNTTAPTEIYVTQLVPVSLISAGTIKYVNLNYYNNSTDYRSLNITSMTVSGFTASRGNDNVYAAIYGIK